MFLELILPLIFFFTLLFLVFSFSPNPSSRISSESLSSVYIDLARNCYDLLVFYKMRYNYLYFYVIIVIVVMQIVTSAGVL
jgi:hypothetical protein